MQKQEIKNILFKSPTIFVINAEKIKSKLLAYGFFLSSISLLIGVYCGYYMSRIYYDLTTMEKVKELNEIKNDLDKLVGLSYSFLGVDYMENGHEQDKKEAANTK